MFAARAGRRGCYGFLAGIQLECCRPADFIGRVFSVSQVQHIGGFGVNKRVEAFASASGGFKAALKSPSVAFGLRVFLSGSVHGGIGQADHHAPDGPQHARGFGSANSALILAQSDVQTMVEPAFDGPVATLEQEHSLGLELLQGQTAHQIDDLSAPSLFLGLRVLTFDASLQSSDQPGSRKEHPCRSYFQAFQASDLQAAAIVFALDHFGLGRGPRGKNSVR